MVGVDVVSVERMEKALAQNGFIKCFTEAERAHCKSAESYAGVYAAKEALVKATGTGLTRSALTEIEVKYELSGAPYYELSGKIKEIVGGRKVHLSISHDGGVAVAVCMLEVVKCKDR